jgi:N-acetyl-gamma-glutamyl-phosphate reductase
VSKALPVAILGGTGYVAGELLRLILGHPDLRLAGIGSASRAGQPVADTFGNLSATLDGTLFETPDAITERCASGAVAGLFCATPHGAAAPALARVIESSGPDAPHIVDSSADFRFRDAARYAAVYGSAHPVPALLDAFQCAVPEHATGTPARHVAHPGCFATAILLSIVPLLRTGLSESDFFVTGVTGSTGSGRTPSPGTHHPERHANLYAYRPLVHRHAPEVEALAEQASGIACRVRFVPHSGPFARGIHATVQGRCDAGIDASRLARVFVDAYADAPFVEVVPGPPRLKDVVGSNRAQIHIAADGGSFVVMTVIDNLIKGAAGGAVQWMNRLLGLAESTGLKSPGPAWI